MTSAGVTDKLFNNWVQSKDQFILLVNDSIDLYRHNLYANYPRMHLLKSKKTFQTLETLCKHIYSR